MHDSRCATRGAAVLALAAMLAGCGAEGGAGAGSDEGAGSTPTSGSASASVTVPGWRVEPTLLIGGAEADEQQRLFGVTSVAEDPEGRLFVANFGDRRIQVFDTTGAFVRSIGRAGEGPGEFAAPRAVAATGSDGLVVLDIQQGRLSRFRRSTGEFVGDVSVRQERLFPRDMRATAAGVVAVEFRPGPSIGGAAEPLIARVDTLTGALSPTHRIAIDTTPRREVVTGEGGERTVQMTDVPFTPRPVWGLDPQGEVVLGTGARFEVFRARGTRLALAFRGEGERPEVTQEEQDAFFDNPARRAWRGKLEIPRQKPYFTQLAVDPDGWYWVQVRSGPRGSRWEVRDPGGRRRGEFSLEGRSRVVGITRGSIYVVRTDDDDVETLQRYRLVRGG